MNTHLEVNMNQRWLLRLFACAVAVALVASGTASARTKDRAGKKDDAPEVQRTLGGAQEQQENIVSAIDFQTTNYGVFGFNVRQGVGGTLWPRGSNNQYVFAGGAWFAALKRQPGGTDYRKRVMITYNPNSGLSWMAPGRIEDGLIMQTSGDAIQNYRTYFSTDFSSSDGLDFQNPTYPKWPIWDSSPNDTLRYNNYFGNYIADPGSRTRLVAPKGPAFVSQEDVFCTYKDTDLSLYEGGPAARLAQGYPLGFQIEQTIYSWGFGDYADIMFLKYLFIHPTSFRDTLISCWMAAVVDVDIALRSNSQRGAANDHAKYYSEEDSLNLAVQWSDGDQGERNQRFGYLGFNFLESPAVDIDGFLRKDKRKFPVNEQLGMKTMRNWPITVDPIENEDRYNFMSSQDRDGDQGPGDRRLLMATGPFNMRPGDSARIVVGIILANTSGGKDATGTVEDLAELVRKVRFAQNVYNNNFIAPRPPDNSAIRALNYPDQALVFPPAGWLPMNNAVAIQWDSTAEVSIDTLERGMDFLGYRVFRARRLDRDTFAIDDQPNASPKRKGPLGWKQISLYPMASPFVKTAAAAIPKAGIFADQIHLVDTNGVRDHRWLVARDPNFNSEPWASYFSALFQARSANYFPTREQSIGAIDPRKIGGNGKVDVSRFDKLDSILFTTYVSRENKDSLPRVIKFPIADDPILSRNNPNGFYRLDTLQSIIARDSLLKLVVAGRIYEEPLLFQDTMNMPDGSVQQLLRPWEETSEVRYGVITKYMRQITNKRTFVDLGDDDGNGIVSYDTDPEKSEKLINNVNYYYAVQAYDEGDQFQASPQKLSQGALGLPNVITARPLGARPGGGEVNYTLFIDDSSKARMGSIHNLHLLIPEPQRFNQMFAGRTLELLFYRSWFGYDIDLDPATQGDDVGMYSLVHILRDSASKQLLSTWSSALPPELCPNSGGISGYFTENGYTWTDRTRVDTARSSPTDTVGFYAQGKDKWVTLDGLKFERIRDINKTQIRIDSAAIDRWLSTDMKLYVRVRNSDGTTRRIDSVLFALPNNNDTVVRPGAYATDARCFLDKYALGTVGIAYDYAMKQWGGVYRPLDSAQILTGPSNLFVGRSDLPAINGLFKADSLNLPPAYLGELGIDNAAMPVGGYENSYNNGPGIYEIEFLPGGTETITSTFKTENSQTSTATESVTFENVPYLEMRIRNVLEYNRQQVNADGTVTDIVVNSPFDYKNVLVNIDTTQSREYPHVEQVPIGSYAIGAYGWRNTGSESSNAAGRIRILAGNANTNAGPVARGHYYLSRAISTTSRDTLDFLHILSIAGTQWTIDWTGRRKRTANFTAVQGNPPDQIGARPDRDFQAGDKIRLFVTGGAAGYPYDGARAYFRVAESDPTIAGGSYTDEQLEDCQVVPNPFYVNHEGMNSSFNSQVYFTRLPRKCTIKIYTTAGDLITTIQHDEATSTTPGKTGADIWNLLSRNRQRVTSQMLVAKIETPEGQSVIRKFSVIVGPARISGETSE